ncbi:MAG TPA: FkbM family methyltransferase [Candidatus Acidoferrum sp.]|nr:FkbM family methyltransferase [Candidatus Acidoferrum sp.]
MMDILKKRTHPMLNLSKNRLESSAREFLLGSRVFGPLRSGYQFFFDRTRYQHRMELRKFYRSFVRPNDLVFDVGAHLGRYAETFADLGATVVSIEPNPQCCAQLRSLAKIRRVHVENCAAGETAGRTKLKICQDSVMSTVVAEWYEEAKRSPLHRDSIWSESVEVEVVTLDQLATRYGTPSFVKIDAEGYDDHVLRGMSFRPRALSFEYNRLLPAAALRCFQSPILESGYEFNFTPGLELRYASHEWLTRDEMRGRVSEFVGQQEYGDIFARATAEIA